MWVMSEWLCNIC